VPKFISIGLFCRRLAAKNPKFCHFWTSAFCGVASWRHSEKVEKLQIFPIKRYQIRFCTPTPSWRNWAYNLWHSKVWRTDKQTNKKLAATIRGSWPGCNPHRSLWRHWWRHNSESIRDTQKLRPRHPMKSSKSYPMVKTASLYDNFCKTGNYVIYDVIIWVQDGNRKKWLERILVLVRSTI